MVNAKFLYRKSDNRFAGGGFYDVQPPMVGDPPAPDWVNFGVAEFGDADVPGQTDMFDPATGGKRPMSVDEIALYFPAPVRTLSRFEFMGILTAQERIALRQRATTDPIMADALEMLNLAGHVDAVPLHPMIAQMLGYVQQLGIMTAERRAAFLVALSEAAK